MNDLSARFPEAHSSDLHIRLMMSAVLNGQFDGVPLNLFNKVDWVDAAQWLADVEGSPECEAQAIAEIEMMLAKSEFLSNRWQPLSEREKCRWGDFDTMFDALTSRRFA
jgi:hypothetical protein